MRYRGYRNTQCIRCCAAKQASADRQRPKNIEARRLSDSRQAAKAGKYTPILMSEADLKEFRIAHSGICDIDECFSKAICPDHDHLTGRLRGYLCRECNLGLGAFKDSPEKLTSAIQYIEEHLTKGGPDYMPRTKKLPGTSPSIQERIRLAEVSIATGSPEKVYISDEDLIHVESLIYSTGTTKAQLLKKAVHLGLAVLTTTVPAPEKMEPPGGCMADFSPEDLYIESDWKRPDPIPYAGFIPAEVADHYSKEVEPVADSSGVAAPGIALEGTV
jgi:recombination endonuclease VII